MRFSQLWQFKSQPLELFAVIKSVLMVKKPYKRLDMLDIASEHNVITNGVKTNIKAGCVGNNQ